MANDQRVNMQMQVEDVKRAIAQEPDPQKKLELAQHGTAYLEDLAKQNPEAYQSVLQANRRQGQAQQGQGGSILRPANPEDGFVDIRQSFAKGSGMTEQQLMEYRKKVDAAKAQQTQYNQQSGDSQAEQDAMMSQDEQDSMMSQYDARDRMQAKARQDALDLQNFRRNQGNQTPVKTPVEQQGIFDRIGSGLKSFGRGMGQYTDKLFNDPSRMAMLQGGLSMMNPNSYYDKQGFGNVFQGLQAGLGQAQAGAKGVYDRRNLIADRKLKEAKAAGARLGANPATSIQEYRKAVAQGYKGDFTDYKKFVGEAGRNITKLSMGGSAADKFNIANVDRLMKEEYPKARTAEMSLFNMQQAGRLLDEGIATGTGTDIEMFLNQTMNKLGFEMDNKDKLDRTRTFVSAMGGEVGNTISLFGAGTGLSDADREFAQSMVGQKVADYTEQSLKQLFALNEARRRYEIEQFNEQVQDFKDSNPDANLFGIKSLARKAPPMSKNLREHIIRNKKEGLLREGENGKIPMPSGWRGGQKNWDRIKAGTAKSDDPAGIF